MKLGIDYGFFDTKSSEADLKYNSGSICSSSDPIGAKYRIGYNNGFYSVGESRSFIGDKTASEDMMIQMLPAIAEAINVYNTEKGESRTKDIPLDLAVGTPLKSYGIEKNKFHSYFSGRVLDFTYNGIEYGIRMNSVTVCPQGYAAYLANYEEYKKYTDINVIDGGGGTYDVFQIRGGKPIVSSFRSLKIGAINLINEISDDLEERNIRITEEQICAAVKNENVFHLKQGEIKDVAQGIAESYISSVLQKILERGFDLSIPCLMIGGTNLMMKDYLADQSINILGFLDEFANAKAFKALIGKM